MKKKRSVISDLILIEQVVYSVAVPIVMCVFLGYYIDKKVNTKGIFTIIFSILGCATAIYNIYRLSGTKSSRK